MWFRVSAKQSGEFVGLPLQEDGRFDVLSGELFTFNEGALAREVTTVTPIGIMKDQVTGARKVPAIPAQEK